MTANEDKVFKALGDGGRRVLLDRLHDHNGQTLGQLCEHLNMTRQAVTKHLKVLESANLVVTIWHGREKLHFLNPASDPRNRGSLDRKIRASSREAAGRS